MSKQESRSGLQETVDELQRRISEFWDHLQNLADRLSNVEDEAEELRAIIEEQNNRIAGMEEQLDNIADLGEKAQSTPEARARDLRILLRNKAKAKAEKDENNLGTVQWTYSQVKDQLESRGHGNVHPHQCYTAMEDAAEADGYAETENGDGERVIRASWSKITSEPDVIQNNNAEGEAPAASTVSQPAKSNSD